MIKAMQENHPGCQVTDLAHATQTKSSEEVTKMFVDSASYILRATVGGKTSAKGKDSVRKATKSGKPLWDPKKLVVDDVFSSISYLKVTDIDGNKITVKNHHGGSWFVSKDLMVRDMWSSDHAARTIKVSMTDLSSIIHQLGDTIFKVAFRKKIDEKQIEQKLSSVKFSDLKSAGTISKLSKDLIEGEMVEMTCHLIDSDNNLGRSMVIDLNAPVYNNFRQVDHRTIEYIIYKNVKYQLGKRDPGHEDLPIKVDRSQPKWDSSKLAVGNWFSQI